MTSPYPYLLWIDPSSETRPVLSKTHGFPYCLLFNQVGKRHSLDTAVRQRGECHRQQSDLMEESCRRPSATETRYLKAVSVHEAHLGQRLPRTQGHSLRPDPFSRCAVPPASRNHCVPHHNQEASHPGLDLRRLVPEDTVATLSARVQVLGQSSIVSKVQEAPFPHASLCGTE